MNRQRYAQNLAAMRAAFDTNWTKAKTTEERDQLLQDMADAGAASPPVEFERITMMDFRKAPGEVINQMRYKDRVFALTHYDKVVAYLIPATGRGVGLGENGFKCEWRAGDENP